MLSIFKRRKERKKKIAVLIFLEGKCTEVLAVLAGTELHVYQANVIFNNNDRSTSLVEIEKYCIEKKDKGFDVVSNIADPELAGLLRPLPLNARAIYGNRSITTEALEAYDKLLLENRLLLADTSMKINSSTIDRLQDDKGNTVYRLNWESIRPKDLAVLLVCHAAIVESPVSKTFLNEFYSLVDGSGSEKTNLERKADNFQRGAQKRRDNNKG